MPTTIGGLKKLKSLNLNDNQLTNLPASLGELKNLEELNLSGNLLTYLPDELRELKKCKICVGKKPTDELRECVKGWKNVFFKDYLF